MKYITLVLVAMILVGTRGEPIKRIVEAHYSGEGKNASSTIQSNNTRYETYPEDPIERELYIREYLALEYTVEELPNEVIENLIRIAKKESSRHDPLVEPKSTVFHCKDNKWFSVENQTGCPVGTVSGRKEKSIGVFQILPSTWEGYKCEGDIKNINDQLDCGVKIYKRSGYKPWYNSSKSLGLI